MKQETVSGSDISWTICKSAPRSRQTTTPAPHHSVFTGRMPFLPPNQQRQSTEGKALKAKWRNCSKLEGVSNAITDRFLDVFNKYVTYRPLNMHNKVTSSPSSDVTEVDPASHFPLKVWWSERSSETDNITNVSITIILLSSSNKCCKSVTVTFGHALPV